MAWDINEVKNMSQEDLDKLKEDHRNEVLNESKANYEDAANRTQSKLDENDNVIAAQNQVIDQQNDTIQSQTEQISQLTETVDKVMDNYNEAINDMVQLKTENETNDSLKAGGLNEKYLDMASQLGITPENIEDMKEQYGELFSKPTEDTDEAAKLGFTPKVEEEKTPVKQYAGDSIRQ